MNNLPAAIQPWRQTRTGFAAFLLASLLGVNLGLRVVLLAAFRPASAGLVDLGRTLATGLVVDLLVALVAGVPLLAWWCLAPARWSRMLWSRALRAAGWTVFWSGIIFLALAEIFFFEEFKSRFNTVAVDYLIYPHEVFINIWDTYPVAWVALAALAAGAGWVVLARKLFPDLWNLPSTRRASWQRLGAVLGAAALLWLVTGNRLTRFSSERVLNEIAGNGWYSFVQAGVTRELDYAPFYRTMPLDEAYARTRALLAETNATFLEEGRSIRRHIAGDASRPKLNVVVFLEESLGSEFFGCLGRPGPTLTPELDRLANTEGLLFTNLYASGNRTVRGMEGVLASFPPLPGDSVVVRPKNDRVETLARVFQRDGYATMFLYGGRGVFDNVRPFNSVNGYERFIEQKDFPKPVFTTIWGVCNEDLYGRGLEECRKLQQSGQPFFVTLLSVSNHKPFTYPKGRIPENPDARERRHAVKYTDYALGQFFQAARRETFWTNTIFVVVADHGARVYGRQTIPMESYEIPLLILGPAAVRQPARVGILGGQLDVAPTLLGLIGRPYQSTFFGRDLLRLPPDAGRALLHHNRDIGLYRDERMAVMSLNKVREFYHGDPKRGQPQPVREPDPVDLAVEADATALFQVADDLYTRRAFNFLAPPGSAPARQPPPAASAR